MSQENFAGTAPVSFTAGGTISRNRLVSLSSGNVVATSAITDLPVGVALHDAVSGEQVAVATISGARVTLTASAAIAAGAALMPTASGSGKVVTGAGATAVSCAIAITAAGADGDFIEAIFRPTLKSPANA